METDPLPFTTHGARRLSANFNYSHFTASVSVAASLHTSETHQMVINGLLLFHWACQTWEVSRPTHTFENCKISNIWRVVVTYILLQIGHPLLPCSVNITFRWSILTRNAKQTSKFEFIGNNYHYLKGCYYVLVKKRQHTSIGVLKDLSYIWIYCASVFGAEAALSSIS